VRWRA
jgi:mitochondrial fission protein ELM1